MSYRNEHLRNTARGMPCMIRTLQCNHDAATTVWVHSDEGAHGKGRGTKASDAAGAWGCSSCHSVIANMARHVREGVMHAAIVRTYLELWNRGLLAVAGHAPRDPPPARVKTKQKYSTNTARPSKCLPRKNVNEVTPKEGPRGRDYGHQGHGPGNNRAHSKTPAKDATEISV